MAHICNFSPCEAEAEAEEFQPGLHIIIKKKKKRRRGEEEEEGGRRRRWWRRGGRWRGGGEVVVVVVVVVIRDSKNKAESEIGKHRLCLKKGGREHDISNSST